MALSGYGVYRDMENSGFVRGIPADLAAAFATAEEIVARAVVCLQASLAHNFDLDPVIAERVASGAAVTEGVLCSSSPAI